MLEIETLKAGIQRVGETIADQRHSELKRGHLAGVRDALRWVVDVSEGATRSIWELILEHMVIDVSPNDTIQPAAAKKVCHQNRPDPPLGCNRWLCDGE